MSFLSITGGITGGVGLAGLIVGALAMRWWLRGTLKTFDNIAKYQEGRSDHWRERAMRAEAAKSLHPTFYLVTDSPVEDLIAISRRELL